MTPLRPTVSSLPDRSGVIVPGMRAKSGSAEHCTGWEPAQALIAVRTGNDAREAAAKTFVQWLTDTERAVGVSLDSGYVPIRQSALRDARIVELTGTDPLVGMIDDQLQYVADSSISPADSLIGDGFLNGVETVQTDPNADSQALLDALQGEIDDCMSTCEKIVCTPRCGQPGRDGESMQPAVVAGSMLATTDASLAETQGGHANGSHHGRSADPPGRFRSAPTIQ